MNAKPKSYPDFVNLKYDFQAGLNVALLAIPQGMAYALIAGLPLHYGLIGSGIAALLGGICGQGKFITYIHATAVKQGTGFEGAEGLTMRYSQILNCHAYSVS